jgi:outer membrane lipoprotein-sorting protein
MSSPRTTAVLLAACCALANALLLRAARADRGDDVLRQMDLALTAAKDQTFDMEMIISEGTSAPRRLGMRVLVKGTQQRRIDFLSPGDVRGLKLLVISRTQMYTYLPAYNKVRRIASHVRGQTMFGADFNYDDMSTVTYSDVYQARLTAETKTHWSLVATRRAGVESPYAKIEMRVRKADKVPDVIYYSNDKGAKIKTETRSDYECRGKMCTAGRMKMVDHTRNGHWTEIVRSKWQVNTGVSDQEFSVRALQRGR